MRALVQYDDNPSCAHWDNTREKNYMQSQGIRCGFTTNATNFAANDSWAGVVVVLAIQSLVRWFFVRYGESLRLDHIAELHD